MQDEEISRLINDEVFLNYCFRRNINDITYWEHWLQAHPEDQAKIAQLKNFVLFIATASGNLELEKQKKALSNRITEPKKKQKLWQQNTFRWTAAAAVLLLISTGIFSVVSQQVETAHTKSALTAIKPVGNQAVLTLSDGTQIILDSLNNGVIANQQNLMITKTSDGQITYQTDKASSGIKQPAIKQSGVNQPEINQSGINQPGNPNQKGSIPSGKTANSNLAAQAYNSITTPNGSNYQITLADGTRVWLNSGSTLKYPAAFTSTQRKVDLIGEAYFEVAKIKEKPFLVQSAGQTVEVLGTHFNINAYADEPGVKTTLLEGVVKVLMSGQPQIGNHQTGKPQTGKPQTGKSQVEKILKPGQQAWLTANTIAVKEADLIEIMAWKNGLFYFKDADLKTILRSFSRWYDVKVIYNGAVTKRKFSGKIYKNVNAYQALEILRLSDVNFKVEKSNGQTTIVISP